MTYNDAVSFAEERLRNLGHRLDEVTTLDPEQAGAIGLLMGLRSRALFGSVHHAIGGPSDAAVRVLLRAMADLAILTAWLRKRPDVHSEVWEGELARQQIVLMEALVTQRQIRPDLDPIPADAASLPEHRRVADAARARALAEGVPGVSRDPRRPIMPAIAERARQIGSPAAFELYRVLVAFLSEWTHAGKGSFQLATQGPTAGAFREPPGNPDDYGLRGVAVTCHAFTLGEVSRWLRLGIEAECDMLRAGVTLPWSGQAVTREEGRA